MVERRAQDSCFQGSVETFSETSRSWIENYAAKAIEKNKNISDLKVKKRLNTGLAFQKNVLLNLLQQLCDDGGFKEWSYLIEWPLPFNLKWWKFADLILLRESFKDGEKAIEAIVVEIKTSYFPDKHDSQLDLYVKLCREYFAAQFNKPVFVRKLIISKKSFYRKSPSTQTTQHSMLLVAYPQVIRAVSEGVVTKYYQFHTSGKKKV